MEVQQYVGMNGYGAFQGLTRRGEESFGAWAETSEGEGGRWRMEAWEGGG